MTSGDSYRIFCTSVETTMENKITSRLYKYSHFLTFALFIFLSHRFSYASFFIQKIHVTYTVIGTYICDM